MYTNNDKFDENGHESENLLGKDPPDLILRYLTCHQNATNAVLSAPMIADSCAHPLHCNPDIDHLGLVNK